MSTQVLGKSPYERALGTMVPHCLVYIVKKYANIDVCYSCNNVVLLCCIAAHVCNDVLIKPSSDSAKLLP